MATVSTSHAKQYDLWLGNRPHPTLQSHFNQAEIESLFEEDLSAGRTVPLLLTSVIFSGMLLALLSVVLLYW